MKIKIGFISDTHSRQFSGAYADGKWAEDLDIVVHAGDLTGRGYRDETRNALKWFNDLGATHKVVIAGNHDFFFDTQWKALTPLGKSRHGSSSNKTPDEVAEILPDNPNFYYLNDSGCEIFGIKFWGSPVTPWFHDWAFNRNRYIEGITADNLTRSIKPHWDMIPDDTDILITHGPPYGILDKVLNLYGSETDYHKGCEYLMERIKEIKPAIHAFGHIHEDYGREEKDGTLFLNCSYLTLRYDPLNAPHIVELELPL
jgi:Icc-related predicted phosphoesterase